VLETAGADDSSLFEQVREASSGQFTERAAELMDIEVRRVEVVSVQEDPVAIIFDVLPSRSGSVTERQAAGAARLLQEKLEGGATFSAGGQGSTPLITMSGTLTVISGMDRCDEYTWPNKDNGRVCGDCKVLVDNMDTAYDGLCDNYCAQMGAACVGAWEEVDDSCTVGFTGSCSVRIPDTSDAICECDVPRVPRDPPQVRILRSRSWAEFFELVQTLGQIFFILL
jgi:hypothetical protein